MFFSLIGLNFFVVTKLFASLLFLFPFHLPLSPHSFSAKENSPTAVKKSFISIPYFGSSSEYIAELKKPYNIKTAFRPVCELRNLIFNFKLKTHPLDLFSVVYLFLSKICDSALHW